MSNLLLEWQENQQMLTRIINGEKTIRNKPTTIGRNPSCDIQLNDVTKTISGVHVGIFFDSTANNFYLINLTCDRPRTNPAIVDGKKVFTEEVILHTGSKIQLGKEVKLQVKAIEKQVQRKSKCSHPKTPHVLPLEYLHGNCPMDGSVVMEEVEV
jgi:pSer/pThr/pTyr-binding forkhead associated (FHA) protein